MTKKKNKELLFAQKLKENIAKLDELEMYSIYQILEKNKANITTNRNGIWFDLLSLESDVLKTLKKFVDQSLKRKNLINKPVQTSL